MLIGGTACDDWFRTDTWNGGKAPRARSPAGAELQAPQIRQQYLAMLALERGRGGRR